MCIFSLHIILLMDIYVIFITWLLWIVLRWTYECYHLLKILISILSNKYPEVRFFEHVYGTSSFTFLWNSHTVFYSSCTNLHFTNSLRVFQFLHNLTNTCPFIYSFLVKIIANLTGMGWYLIVVLICVYVMISGSKYFLIYTPLSCQFISSNYLSLCWCFI